MKPERGSTCSGDSERLCCNGVRRGKSSSTTGWGTRIQAWEIATVSSLWTTSSTVKNRPRKLAWALTYRRLYLGYVGYNLSATSTIRKRPKWYNEQRVK